MFRIRLTGYHEVKPGLQCHLCESPIRLAEAWLIFTALTDASPESDGFWVHRTCPDGEVGRLFKQSRMLLWKGTDFLATLMRDTQIEEPTPAPRPGPKPRRRAARPGNAR
jgi:hypothetical protein